jgi:5-carboxymethyl-2-hydroxymuconate isomerase
MNHDPLCLADPTTDNSRCHYCVLIAKVREDERNKDLGETLAKCIKAIERTLATLTALQEKQ